MSSKFDQSVEADKRKAFRCQIADMPQEAALNLGRTKVPAQLINESAGGFAVRVEQDPGVEVDQVVRLRTGGGCFEVRVAHITEELRDETDDGSAEASFVVGLERRKDLEVWDNVENSDGRRSRPFLRRFIPSGTTVVVVLVGTLLVCVVFSIAAFASLLYLDPPLAEQIMHWSCDQVAAAYGKLPNLSQWRPEPVEKSDQWRQSRVTERSTWNDIPSTANRHSTVHISSGLRNEIRRNPGATVFLLPRVVSELNLTDSQQAAICRIIAETAATMRHKTANRDSATYTRLLINSRYRAVALLNTEQRNRWEILHDAARGQ